MQSSTVQTSSAKGLFLLSFCFSGREKRKKKGKRKREEEKGKKEKKKKNRKDATFYTLTRAN